LSAAATRRTYLVVLLVLFLRVMAASLVRQAVGRHGVAVVVDDGEGHVRTVSLEEMKRLPVVSRPGSYENQFGNWRDQGTYTGVRFTDLLPSEADYVSVRVVAKDGYTVDLPRERVVEEDYPLVLAYAFDGVEVPAWQDGFRVAVLPEDGSVSNEEYHAPSAGAFWVKNVTRITLTPRRGR